MKHRTSNPKAVLPQGRQRLRWDLRGAVSIVFAVCLMPLLIAVSVGIDFSRMADSRTALQRAVDNAAISGAAAYSVNAQAAQTKAIVSAESTFCQATVKLPAGTTLVGAGTQACSTSTGGPTVTTQIGGFVAGTPGVVKSGCSATTPVVSGVTCGFIVTVSASLTLPTTLPVIFGASKTLTVTAIAANPFVNIGTAMSAQVYGSPWNNNSIWVYPLLLDANGNPDFTTNAGAIPGLPSGWYPADASAGGCTSATACGTVGTAAGANCAGNAEPSCLLSPQPTGCTDNPLQFVCGNFTMLATTYFFGQCTVSAPCYPNGTGTYPEIINGVIQNPQAPPSVITATTPIGVAFESIAGAGAGEDYGFGKQNSNGCWLPGGAVYNTYAAEFDDPSNTFSITQPNANEIDYPKVTHWFYSSYLANPAPVAPTEGEILSQLHPLTSPMGGAYNLRIPTVGQYATAPTNPSPLATVCEAGNSAADTYGMTTFPTSGATNGSLFILEQAVGSPFIQASSTGYVGEFFTPADTPGHQYAALSCQAYGNNVFTFYWNDMGGQGADNLNYQDGTVQVACSGTSFVLLIG